MKKEHAVRIASLSAWGLAGALVLAAPAAVAQEAMKPAQPAPEAGAAASSPASTSQPAHPGQAEMAEGDVLAYERPQVGDTTQALLAWQRSGEIASPTPRPIAGAVANRSYERYMKSFEFPIPERMSSIVKSSSSSGGGGSK